MLDSGLPLTTTRSAKQSRFIAHPIQYPTRRDSVTRSFHLRMISHTRVKSQAKTIFWNLRQASTCSFFKGRSGCGDILGIRASSGIAGTPGARLVTLLGVCTLFTTREPNHGLLESSSKMMLSTYRLYSPLEMSSSYRPYPSSVTLAALRALVTSSVTSR